MKLLQNILYNTGIQLLSKFLSAFLGFLTITLIARHLGTLGFGQYTTAITFISFFAMLADFGITLVTSQMISEPKADEKKIIANIFTIRLLSAIVFIIIAPLSIIFFPYSSEIKTAVFLVSFSFVFIALNQVFVGIFQKHLKMDRVSLSEVISRIFLFLAIYIALKQGFSLFAIMIITTLASLLNFILHFIFSYKICKISFDFDIKYWREIFKRSWPLAITIAFNLLYLKTDTLLLSIIPRPSKIGIINEVGLYGAAYKVIDVLITIPFMFSGIILPLITKTWFSNNKQEFYAIMQKSFDFLLIVAVPILIGTEILARDIMILIGGQAFADSGEILQILIIAGFFIFAGNIFSHAIVAIKEQKKLIKAYAFTALTSIFGYLIFIPCASYFGAAWVTVYSEALIALFSAFYVWKFSSFVPNFKEFFKIFIAGLLMGAFVYLAKFQFMLNFWLIVIISPFIYFLFLYVVGGLKEFKKFEIIKITSPK